MNTKKEITIYDIARELSLSPSTISRALNRTSLVHEETRARIQQKAKDLGYRQNFFASSLRSHQTHVIAAMVPQLNTRIASNIVSGAETVARQSGYNLVVSQWMNDTALYAAGIEHLTKSRVDGLLLTAAGAHQHALLPESTKPDMPRVVIEASSALSDLPGEITQRIFSTGYELTAYLLKRGCRRITFMATRANAFHKDALAGYRQALQNHGISSESVLTGFDTARPGMDVCRRLLCSSSRPDGIIFLNGMLTALSIGNFDVGQVDTSFSSTLNSELTIDNTPMLELGNVATSLLICCVESSRER